MLLKPLNQVIEGYNDKIVINTSGLNLGKTVKRISKSKAEPSSVILKKTPQISTKDAALYHVRKIHTLDDHEDEKQAIILAICGLTLLTLWWVH